MPSGDTTPEAAFRESRVVVTGGAHGIGAAICTRLRSAGAHVVVLDVEEPDGDGEAIRVDLADPDSVLAAAEDASALLGGVDVLVNCAGIAYVADVVDLDLVCYHHLLAVNLHAPVMLMRAYLPGMIARGSGRIVNVTSVHARASEPGCLAYDVAKAGLEAATRTAAVESTRHGVLVNAVAPGFVATRMAIVDGKDELDSDWFRTVYLEHGQLPAGRAAAPSEIAESVAWLASPANTYTSGQVLVVDGGLTARL